MLIIFEAADLNLDFLSVRILCSTFARTDSQETLLVLDLELQSCNNVAAVRYVGASKSSDWKSRYLTRSRVMSGISDLRASNRNSAPGLMVEHFSRACSRLSISPSEHETHRGEGAFDMFILCNDPLDFLLKIISIEGTGVPVRSTEFYTNHV